MEPSISAETLPLLQARILSRLFCDRVCNIVLKGGMAMRVVHGHSRNTMDIDLDADPALPLHRLQAIMRRAIREATADGILSGMVISEPKQTETTARWKINAIIPQTGLPINLKVEVSFRNHVQDSDVRSVSYHPPELDGPATIQVYRDERLVINKIHALMSPAREAPRDVLDLFILFESGVVLANDEIDGLVQGVVGEDVERAVKLLWSKLSSMDEEQFRQKILPIWSPQASNPEWSDWLAIRMMVGEHVEHYFRQSKTTHSKAHL
jgi:predicted nucleotidyltransferase component of viral defense system